MAEADSLAAIQLDANFCVGLLPRRDPEGHKGTFGTVVCVAGSLDYVGAALLTATSAARGGAGLVALAVPRWIQPVVAGRVPEIVTLGLPAADRMSDLDVSGSVEALRQRAADAVVFGPGISNSEGYGSLLVSLLRESGVPVVIDGTGLTLLSEVHDWWSEVSRPCLLTPHPGEFERLTGSALGTTDWERRERCLAAARVFGHVVVLKGARTVIAAPDGRVAVATFEIAALATAGTGDVLAGLIGALLAQGARPFEAACLGVYLHGRAGERLSWRFGDAGLLASDLPHEIALARHELSAHSA